MSRKNFYPRLGGFVVVNTGLLIVGYVVLVAFGGPLHSSSTINNTTTLDWSLGEHLVEVVLLLGIELIGLGLCWLDTLRKEKV